MFWIQIGCLGFHHVLFNLCSDDRSVRDSERRAAIMHFTSDQVLHDAIWALDSK